VISVPSANLWYNKGDFEDLLPAKRSREVVESIDSQRVLKERRAEAERFVQAALDALTAHVAILDDSGTIINVNAAWREYGNLNGLRDEKYGIGTNYLTVCDKSASMSLSDANAVAQGIRDVMAQRRAEFYLEYPCHSPREKSWYVVRVTRFEWYGMARYIVAHQNVTELKRAQLELEESQTRLQTIFDTVVNGIITLDEHNVVEMANPAAAAIFGYTQAEMVGMPYDALLESPCELESLQSNIYYERIGLCKDGSIFPMNFAMSEVSLNERRLFTLVIEDITERKRMEAELVEKEKLSMALEKEREMREFKARFLSMMSHELRTPLTSIRLSYDMLTTYADQTPDDEKRQFLDNIRNQVEYLSDLVKDVMTLSKAEIQQLEFAPEKVDLLTYCRAVTEEFQLTYHKTHRIEFSTDCMRVEALMDRKLLRQALNNLLSNAVKYSPNGGRVRVELLNEGEAVAIRVSDSGIGIPQQDVPMLFEPFRRASNVGSLPGTGLGLAITQQAIEIHGGRIDVDSTLGQGTTFTIHLPVLRAELLRDDDEEEWE
jgi:PAS domain S-box-containing protein